MNYKKILGLLILACGIALICISFYIKSQVHEGKLQISDAREKVEQGKKLFSMSPVTEEIGEGIASSAQGKLHAASQKADYYQSLSNWLMVIGIIAVVLGFVIVVMVRKKR